MKAVEANLTSFKMRVPLPKMKPFLVLSGSSSRRPTLIATPTLSRKASLPQSPNEKPADEGGAKRFFCVFPPHT